MFRIDLECSSQGQRNTKITVKEQHLWRPSEWGQWEASRGSQVKRDVCVVSGGDVEQLAWSVFLLFADKETEDL